MGHGAYCLGCCWSLMLLLIALGIMNIFVMLGLAGVVVLEKYSVRGEAISRLVAVAAVVLAVSAVVLPQAGLGMPVMTMST